jgi:hypothetical protein
MLLICNIFVTRCNGKMVAITKRHALCLQTRRKTTTALYHNSKGNVRQSIGGLVTPLIKLQA